MGNGSSKEAFAENAPLVAPPQGLLGAVDAYASTNKSSKWVLSWGRPASLPKQAGEADGADSDEDAATAPSAADKGKGKEKEKKKRFGSRRYYVSDAATGELVFTSRMRRHKIFSEDVVIKDANERPLYRLVSKPSRGSSYPEFHAYRYRPEVYERFARGEDDEELEGREYLDMGGKDAEASAETAVFSITARFKRRLKLNIQTRPIHRSSAPPSYSEKADLNGSITSAATSDSVFIQLRTNGQIKPDGIIMMQQNGERVMTKKERREAAKEESLGQAQDSALTGAAPAPADDDDSLSKKSSSFSTKRLFGKKHKGGDDGSSDESDWDEYEEASDAREGMATLGGQPLLKLGTIRERKDTGFMNRTFYPSFEMELAPNLDPTMICAACVAAQIVFEIIVSSTSAAAGTATVLAT